MATNLESKINDVLKTFPAYWEEGNLLKHKVIDDLREYDETLIDKLLSDDLIRETYSVKVGSSTIFKLDDFIKMLRYKKYWENSYTRYRNHIGLTSEGKYMQYNSDVVLDFPYKDSVLEGGMTKEEIGKEEVYYHNVLAKEEIDILESPKILTNIKKYDQYGEHEITAFKDSDNLIIKGNNLIALHTLKERFTKKVKFIYIDPPYNLESDSFKYNDNFNHSTWLTFMKNRLEIARELLTEDGVICVQINDNEAAYLKVLMDGIFGRESYLTTQYIRVRYPDKTLKQDSVFHKEVEQIFMYKKNKDASISPNLKESDYAYENFKYYINTNGKPSSTITLGNKKVEIYEKGNYEIVEGDGTEDGLKEIWATGTVLDGNSSGRFFRDYLDGRYKEDGYGVIYKIWGIGEDKFDYRYFTGPKKEGATKGKYYQGVPLSVLENPDSKQTKPIEGFIDLAGSFGNNRHEGGASFGSGKKPEVLLQGLISYFSNEGDIVMDFFLGSGTTTAVAHKMNRQYIGIEQMNYIQDFAVPRLNKVINGDSTGASKLANWQGGGSFVYAELHDLNNKYIKDIQESKNGKELETLLDELLENAHMNFKFDFEKLKEKHEDFDSLTLKQKKDVLIGALDMNQLYLSYSEIEDMQHDIDEETREFNHSFYRKGKDSNE